MYWLCFPVLYVQGGAVVWWTRMKGAEYFTSEQEIGTEENTDMYIWVMVCIVKNGLGSLNKIISLLLTSKMYILYLLKFENVIILLCHDKVLCVQL